MLEQLQSILDSLKIDQPFLLNINAIIAILIVVIPMLYLILRKIMNRSNTASQQSNHPHPQDKALPTDYELMNKILLHLAIKQINDPFIFEYSDMPQKYTIQKITRHLNYCLTKGYIEGSVDDENQIATLIITTLGRYIVQNIPTSKYL